MEVVFLVCTREHEGNTEFLMVRNGDRGWELPGGKIESNEGPVRAALREFIEETGHFLEAPRHVLKQQREHMLAHVFHGHMGDKVPNAVPDAAIVEIGWFGELPKENLAFPDDPYGELEEALGFSLRG